MELSHININKNNINNVSTVNMHLFNPSLHFYNFGTSSRRKHGILTFKVCMIHNFKFFLYSMKSSQFHEVSWFTLYHLV